MPKTIKTWSVDESQWGGDGALDTKTRSLWPSYGVLRLYVLQLCTDPIFHIVRPKTIRFGQMMHPGERFVMNKKQVAVVSFWNFMAMDIQILCRCDMAQMQATVSPFKMLWLCMLELCLDHIYHTVRTMRLGQLIHLGGRCVVN